MKIILKHREDKRCFNCNSKHLRLLQFVFDEKDYCYVDKCKCLKCNSVGMFYLEYLRRTKKAKFIKYGYDCGLLYSELI